MCKVNVSLKLFMILSFVFSFRDDQNMQSVCPRFRLVSAHKLCCEAWPLQFGSAVWDGGGGWGAPSQHGLRASGLLVNG